VMLPGMHVQKLELQILCAATVAAVSTFQQGQVWL